MSLTGVSEAELGQTNLGESVFPCKLCICWSYDSRSIFRVAQTWIIIETRTATTNEVLNAVGITKTYVIYHVKKWKQNVNRKKIFINFTHGSAKALFPNFKPCISYLLIYHAPRRTDKFNVSFHVISTFLRPNYRSWHVSGQSCSVMLLILRVKMRNKIFLYYINVFCRSIIYVLRNSISITYILIII